MLSGVPGLEQLVRMNGTTWMLELEQQGQVWLLVKLCKIPGLDWLGALPLRSEGSTGSTDNRAGGAVMQMSNDMIGRASGEGNKAAPICSV